MFRSHWSNFVVACWLTVVCLSGQAQESQENTKRPSNEQSAATNQLPVPLPIVVIETEEATVAREQAEKESAEREKADLVAQTGMNAATERMAKYAFWQTALIFIGTIALIWTLFETRQMTLATRDIGQKQIRAYLTVKDSKFAISKEGRLFIFIEVKNVGQSPAVVTELTIELQSILINDRAINTFKRDEFAPKRVIAAESKEIFSADWNLEGVDFSDGVKAPYMIHIGGHVVYRDVFGEPDSTHFFASNLNPIEYFRTHEENLCSGALQVYTQPEAKKVYIQPEAKKQT